MITKKLSNAFQIANLFATLLVVAIHFNTKHFIDLEGTLPLNYLIQEFITNGVARVAVPFFSFSAGLFFFLKLKHISDYHANLIKRFRTIILPYIVCSSIIFISEYLFLALYKNEPFLLTPQSLLNDILLHPLAVQFWFLRDLIILILIAPVIWLLTRYLGYFFAIILLILWALDIEFMPLLVERRLITIETLTFFSLGCLVSTRTPSLEKIINATSFQLLSFITLLYLSLIIYRIYIDPFFLSGDSIQNNLLPLLIHKTYILIGLFLLLVASYLSTSKNLIYFSSYTFFVYMFHTLSINRFIVKFTDFFIDDAYKFYITFPIAIIITFYLAILFQKYSPAFYAIISGGRNHKKILNRN